MNFHESADRDFSIQFCEYNYSNPDYDQIYRPNGSGDYLFLLFKTPMKVYLDKKLNISKENACILYAPGYEQHYKAVHRFRNSYLHCILYAPGYEQYYKAVHRFRNSYLHFSCKADLKKQYGIPLNTVFYPGNCEEIDACIRLLHKEHIANDLFSDKYEYTLFQQLMITIARGLKSHQIHGSGTEGDSLYSAFRKLRLEMLTNYAKPWDTTALCKKVSLEKSQFYSCYQKFFQSTPHADLLQIRMDKAKNLLTNEALTVQQIAQMCGFSDFSHFSRYFRKQVGCSPLQWRRKMGEPH